MARATKTSKTIWWFWYVLMLMLRARAPTRQLSDVSKKHRSRLARQNMAEPRQPGFDSAHFSISYFGDLWWNNLCLRLLNRLNPFSAAFPGAPWIPWSKMIKMPEMRFWGSDCVRRWWSSRRLLPRVTNQGWCLGLRKASGVKDTAITLLAAVYCCLTLDDS